MPAFGEQENAGVRGAGECRRSGSRRRDAGASVDARLASCLLTGWYRHSRDVSVWSARLCVVYIIITIYMYIFIYDGLRQQCRLYL